MDFAKFTLYFWAEKNAFMPRHKCNVLRSALGPAIKETLGQEAFNALFEGQGGAERLPQLAKVPPYIFECSDQRTFIKQGKMLRVIFLLIAPNKFQTYDLEKVCKRLGQGLANKKNEFGLERVEEQIIKEDNLIAKAKKMNSQQITITMKTPLLLRKSKKTQVIREPSFIDIIQFAWQRAWAMGEAWDGSVPSWAPEELKEKAEKVRTVYRNTNWIDWGRNSRRQHRRVKMGGVMGEISFAGNLADFLPLLAFAEVAHLGAGVTTGNGKIVIGA